MFINDKIAYVQLQKTACTHIASVLHSLAPGEFRAKHSPLLENAGDRLVVGSIRNPWDWYVSLWAFGCLGRGAMHTQLTYSFPAVSYRMARAAFLHPLTWSETARKIVYHTSKDHREWASYYADATNAELFRAWLRALFSEKGKLFSMENYPFLPLREFAGLFTYRFLQLYIDWEFWHRHAADIRTTNQLSSTYADHCIIDRFIRMEALENDLSQVLDEVGTAYVFSELKSRKKSNTSKHFGAGYYYDPETVELVRAQDYLIVDAFGYNPPETLEPTLSLGT